MLTGCPDGQQGTHFPFSSILLPLTRKSQAAGFLELQILFELQLKLEMCFESHYASIFIPSVYDTDRWTHALHTRVYVRAQRSATHCKCSVLIGREGSDPPRATEQGGWGRKRAPDPKGRLPNGLENSRASRGRREGTTSAIA